MRRPAGMVVLVALSLAAAVNAPAAVRVDVDEVIFTLRAPDATEVYLVGDFNQWNPTVEPMARVDDEFEVGLFLVAGTYRYKFVVDGKWSNDPDNPGSSPEKGSPLSLVERSGGLILSTELPDEPGAAQSAEFGIRYIGLLTGEDGESDGWQRIDGRVSATLEHLRACGVVATDDSTWSDSPLSMGLYFDRGSVDVVLDKFTFRGFENDSSWVSSDPTGIVGDAGVFGYDAGFRRHGVSAVAASSHVALRGVYADETTRRVDTPVPQVDLSGFAGGTAADTTAYATADSDAGSDMLAFEAAATFGDAAIGYTTREERGLNPGVLAIVTRGIAAYTTDAYATREERRVSSVWASFGAIRGLRATASYGWGGSTASAYGAAAVSGGLPATVSAASATTPVDASYDIARTERGIAGLTMERGRGHAGLRWDYTQFDFDGVAGNSRAEVHRAFLEGGAAWETWSLDASVHFTSARYRDTPDDLHIDWPGSNPWLSLWDSFSVPELARLGLDESTVFSVGARTNDRRIDVGGGADFETPEVAARLDHVSARAWADAVLSGPWYAAADGRFAWYDARGAVSGGGFWSAYVEAGYRTGRVAANVGVGFDPVAFDPVISDYADTGRERFLRGALDDGFGRGRAGEIRDRLVELERDVSDATTIKVEFILRLP